MTDFKTLGADIENIVANSITVKAQQQHELKGTRISVEGGLPEYLINSNYHIPNSETPEQHPLRKSILNYDADHFFPNCNLLAKFSAEVNLDIYRSTALLLKGQWEYFFACEFQNWRSGETALRPLSKVLDCCQIKTLSEAKTKFKPDFDALYAALENQGKQISQNGLDQKSFRLLGEEMVLNEIFLQANDGFEMFCFAKRHLAETSLLKPVESEKRETFWVLKCEWLRGKQALEEKLFQVENIRFENAHIAQLWLQKFGKEYIPMEEEHQRMLNAKCLVDLKELDPDITHQQIEHIAKERQKKSEGKINKLKEERLRVKFPSMRLGGYADQKELARIAELCKQTLRKIWLLTHPDRLRNNNVYDKLTDQQKLDLEKAFHEAVEIQSSELGYRPGQVGWDNRSLQTLETIRMNVETILDNAGIDINVEFVVKGETLEEKIVFLENENQLIAEGVDNAKTKLIQLLDDEDIKEKRRQLKNFEMHDTIRTQMVALCNQYKAEAEALESKLQSMFVEEETPCLPC